MFPLRTISIRTTAYRCLSGMFLACCFSSYADALEKLRPKNLQLDPVTRTKVIEWGREGERERKREREERRRRTAEKRRERERAHIKVFSHSRHALVLASKMKEKDSVGCQSDRQTHG